MRRSANVLLTLGLACASASAVQPLVNGAWLQVRLGTDELVMLVNVDVKLYDGSMVDRSARPELPVRIAE